MQVGKYSYIVLAGNPQLKNESNDFDTNVLCACDSASDSLHGVIFLNSVVDGVSCESKWVQDTIHRFISGKFQHVGINNLN